MESPRVRIMNLNTWGLPDCLGAKNPILHSYPFPVPSRTARMRAIAAAMIDFDIAAFQEVWLPTDAKFLKTEGEKNGMPYSHYFRRGVVGTGIMVVSRFPIIQAEYLFLFPSHAFRPPEEEVSEPYTLNGKPQRLHHGDWYSSKGICHVRMQHPHNPKLTVDLYVTHLVSLYSQQETDEYRGHRILQCFELSEYIERTRLPGSLVLSCGDFNCKPDSAEYLVLTRHGGLRDAYREAHPDEPEELGCTHVIDVFVPEAPKRIDYVFYSPPRDQPSPQPGAWLGWHLCGSRVILKETDHDPPFVYSDHYAVTAEFACEPSPAPAILPPPAVSEAAVLADARRVLANSIRLVNRRLLIHNSRAILASLVGLLLLAVQRRSLSLPPLLPPLSNLLALLSSRYLRHACFAFASLEFTYVFFYKRHELGLMRELGARYRLHDLALPLDLATSLEAS